VYATYATSYHKNTKTKQISFNGFDSSGLDYINHFEKKTALKVSRERMAIGKVVVITGCSRGVGLGLVQEYAKRGWQVVATCRSPEKADQLKSIAQDRPDLKVFACDISTDESITTCVSAIRSSGISKVDLLINNAGVSNRDHPDDPASTTDRTEFNSIFNTNVAGPLSVTKAMAGLLEASSHPVVINISSLLGSISSSSRFSTTSYQCSKAALNMLTRCQADAFPSSRCCLFTLDGFKRIWAMQRTARLRHLCKSPLMASQPSLKAQVRRIRDHSGTSKEQSCLFEYYCDSSDKF